jgi:hypothetical protein
MSEIKSKLENAVPFAIEPVVYDFAINEKGTYADFLRGKEAVMPKDYYMLTIPSLLRMDRHHLSPTVTAELDLFSIACRNNPEFSGVVKNLFDHLLPRFNIEEAENQDLESLQNEFGFDPVQHEQIRADLRSGRIGLAQNRLPITSKIEDVQADDIFDISNNVTHSYKDIGMDALAEGAVAVVSLAAGVGSRWTHGAGVVKALNPFCKLAGKHRNFIEVHLAKSQKTSRLIGTEIPHVITTSYLTDAPISAYLEFEKNYNYSGDLYLSPGRNIGLRLIPMARDLRFAWEEMPQQLLDEQAQKVRESLQAALISWAQQMGEGSDYTDNLPMQCLHPVGHWYEVPNMLRNGLLAKMLESNPKLKYLMVHNIDTLGANIDPAVLGYHIDQKSAMTTEVITKRIDDRGGGLANVNGQPRLVEGLALPREEIEFKLSYYNSNTMWLDIDKLLAVFGLERSVLSASEKVLHSVRELASRMPTYITLKDVKKRWGKGQEDIYPVTQFEKLWGDMTALPEFDCSFVVVPRMRGQQLKEPAQLDGWLRDGSADYVETLGDWT